MKKEEIIGILKEAKKGEGAHSQDRHEHAKNTIENMKSLIGKAIELLEKLETKEQ